MNRAEAERTAMTIIDKMAEEYRIERHEILEAMLKPDIQNAISERILFDRLCEEGKTVPMARKIMGKSMYLK